MSDLVIADFFCYVPRVAPRAQYMAAFQA